MTIARKQQPHARKFFLLAILLSVLLHIFGGALIGLFSRIIDRIVPKHTLWASLQEPPPAKQEIIRLEKRAVVARAHNNIAVHVAPRAHPVAPVVHVPSSAPSHREIAHITRHAPQQDAPAHVVGHAVAPPAPKVAPPASAAHRPAYSDQQIAQLGDEFSKTIAASHEDLGTVQAESEKASVETMKHFTMPVVGIHAGMNPGDGEIRAISSQRIGKTMWYYTHYEYMYGDGHVEEDDIPWPFHYPINDDPFARHDKRIALQAPPPDYKPNRPLKPILMQFFGGPQVQ